MAVLPDIQLALRPGIVEFGWGHPDLELLPVDGLRQAADLALKKDGSHALAYGAEQGPGRLIEQWRIRLGRLEGTAPAPEQVLITGSVSQALDLICTLFTRPGDTILVDSPTYHLALRIFRDHGLQMVGVPSDDLGLQPDGLAETLRRLRSEGRQPRLLYIVPTFGNPTGACLPLDRRHALLAIAGGAGLTVLEDDVYRELWYEAPPPPPLFNLAPIGQVIRLGSFSKILAPGLRLGWMVASPEVVRRCVTGGLLDSGGGVNHFTAHVVAGYLKLDLLDPHIAALRLAYGRRRDMLLAALGHHLSATCKWARPGGGFFVWLRLPQGVDSSALLAEAEQAGVSFVPGSRFCTAGGGEQYLRLAFSLLPPREFDLGVERLATVLAAGPD